MIAHRIQQKPICYGHFWASLKIPSMASGDKRTHASLVSQTSGAYATYGVETSSRALHPAKMLVFLSRCSNPDAVFAIPAGTKRHRHSLMARRAAWRRSERRRRSQRRKRAQGRPSAGRRSKHALLLSLRLRTTSMTASHGPARVEERCAHRSRTSTPPVPVDDRGRRRDRGTSFTGSVSVVTRVFDAPWLRGAR